MIAELHNRLDDPLKVPTTRVLITTDDGTPVALITEYANSPKSWIRVHRAGDPDFQDQLRRAGVNRTVLVTKLDAGKLAVR